MSITWPTVRYSDSTICSAHRRPWPALPLVEALQAIVEPAAWLHCYVCCLLLGLLPPCGFDCYLTSREERQRFEDKPVAVSAVGRKPFRLSKVGEQNVMRGTALLTCLHTFLQFSFPTVHMNGFCISSLALLQQCMENSNNNKCLENVVLHQFCPRSHPSFIHCNVADLATSCLGLNL